LEDIKRIIRSRKSKKDKRRIDNTMVKRRIDNTMVKRRIDNTMVKRKRTKG